MSAAHNGGRIGRFRKVDVLFVVALVLIASGAGMTGLGNPMGISLVIAGLGAAGIPLAQRGDKG